MRGLHAAAPTKGRNRDLPFQQMALAFLLLARIGPLLEQQVNRFLIETQLRQILGVPASLQQLSITRVIIAETEIGDPLADGHPEIHQNLETFPFTTSSDGQIQFLRPLNHQLILSIPRPRRQRRRAGGGLSLGEESRPRRVDRVSPRAAPEPCPCSAVEPT